ncbi:MAG: hypothetical protein WAM53_19660 [Terrimicrobiaceae bacterium]
MNERTIQLRFEKGNVAEPDEAAFDVVGDEDEIITMKCSGLAFLALHGRWSRLLPLFLDCA